MVSACVRCEFMSRPKRKMKAQKALDAGEHVGCLGGLVGDLVDGDQKGLSVILIFKYVNKQDVFIPNMVQKIVNDFRMGFRI